MPIVSVNPEADPPQPRAPVRPNRAEQDGETTEEKSQEHKHKKEKESEIGDKRHVEKQSRKRTRDESRQAHEPRKQKRKTVTDNPHPSVGGTGHAWRDFCDSFKLFIQEGNRAPVAKATHARDRGGTPLPARETVTPLTS